MAVNILDILAERQVMGAEFAARRLFNHTHGHASLVERLGFAAQLEGHRGCVNCLQWSSDGSYLLSGSDDLSAILWDPYRRREVVTMPTGHTGNIFSVKFVPFTGDSNILTGAEDRDVRLHDLHAMETKRVWSCSGGRVKRLAVHGHSPHLIWTAAEDGCVRQLDLRQPHSCAGDGSCRNVLVDLNQYCSGTPNNGPQVKCLDINPVRPEELAVGAFDPYVRVYDTRALSLRQMTKSVCTYGDPACLAHFAPGHISNPTITKKKDLSVLATTYLSYSPDGRELLVNLSGEQVYLFDTTAFTESIKYDFDKSDSDSVPRPRFHRFLSTYDTPRVAMPPGCHMSSSHVTSERLVSQATLDVSAEVKEMKWKVVDLLKVRRFTTAVDTLSEAVRLCPTWHELYYLRSFALFFRKWDGDHYAALRDAETSLYLNPTSQKAHRWRLKCLLVLGYQEECTRLLQHYQEMFPVDTTFVSKFKTEVAEHVTGSVPVDRKQLTAWEVGRQGRAYDYKRRYCGHCNTHTDIKEASFIGDGSGFVAAGSDDGNIFIWEKDSGRLVHVLQGDDSIVNCVQWHPTGPLLASSGIESVVRLWEPRPHSEEQPRLVTELDKVTNENQKRMSHDPFEVMLMRLGFNIALSRDAPPPDPAPQADSDEEQEERGGGDGVQWIEDPQRCRQS